MGELDPRAIARVSGPSWGSICDKFLRISEAILSVSPEACGELTTIYVKYTTGRPPTTPAYAVVWLKTSKRIVVGLSLPDSFDSSELGPPPAGTKYKGLTKYFLIEADGSIPKDLDRWAKLAYDHVLSHT